MVCRRQRAFAHALAGAVMLAAPNAARAEPAPALEAWASQATARALQAAGPNNDPRAGARELLNSGARLSLQALRENGPDWLRHLTLDFGFAENLAPTYDVAATRPLQRSWRRGDLLWLRGHVGHAAGGPVAGDLGLYWRPPLAGRDVTLSLSALAEDYGTLDYQRLGVAAALRSSDLEVSGRLFDDVASSDRAAGGVGDRDLDGYDLALAARLPHLPWAWLRARRRWQIAVDSDIAQARNDLSLLLRPFETVEVESGLTETDERSDWFGRLRLKMPLDLIR
jgi:hypothetical protein